MKTFEVEITETLQRIIKVKANSENEAYEIVKEKYDNEEIVLDASDCTEISINNVHLDKM